MSVNADPQAVLLCVDDEPSILSALRRLFRPCGYRVLLAESGAAALALLEGDKVDLVISDMRMPVMDGAQFLEQVRLRQPQAVRILLTGYADIASTIAAINEAQIARFIAKPWHDHELLCTIQQLLQIQALNLENIRLAGQAREREGLLSPQERERRRLESLDPGITRVNWGPDGSFILEDPAGDSSDLEGHQGG